MSKSKRKAAPAESPTRAVTLEPEQIQTLWNLVVNHEFSPATRNHERAYLVDVIAALDRHRDPPSRAQLEEGNVLMDATSPPDSPTTGSPTMLRQQLRAQARELWLRTLNRTGAFFSRSDDVKVTLPTRADDILASVFVAVIPLQSGLALYNCRKLYTKCCLEPLVEKLLVAQDTARDQQEQKDKKPKKKANKGD